MCQGRADGRTGCQAVVLDENNFVRGSDELRADGDHVTGVGLKIGPADTTS
jgi:hypothetical protein